MSATLAPERASIDLAHTRDLSAILPSWDAWEQGMAQLEQRVGGFKALAGTLGQVPRPAARRAVATVPRSRRE
jgi:hypothetical protein